MFGDTNSIKCGWVTIGKNLLDSNFDLKQYDEWFKDQENGQLNLHDYKFIFILNFIFRYGRYTGTTLEIEKLRPKSPSKKG